MYLVSSAAEFKTLEDIYGEFNQNIF